MILQAPQSGTPGGAGITPIEAHILVITAPYYADVAAELMAGASEELEARGATFDTVSVEGALEIPQALVAAVDAGLLPSEASEARYDGVIVLGCVIRGETSHYDVVVNNANHWLMQVVMDEGIPLGNAILTVDNKEQAMRRAGGGREGKGADAARACLGLIELRRNFLESQSA